MRQETDERAKGLVRWIERERNLPNEAARVPTIGTSLRSKARRMCRHAQRQIILSEHDVSDHVGHRHLRVHNSINEETCGERRSAHAKKDACT